MMLWKRLLLLTSYCLCLVACSSIEEKQTPLITVDQVDLERYAGQWYVIANVPYFFEKGNVATRVIYRPREDGRFDDEYYYKKNFESAEKSTKGVAWVIDDNNTHWRSRFIWPFTFDFHVIGVDENYQTLVLGHSSRKYGWIMARTPHMPDTDYANWLSKLEENGYQKEQFFKVPQKPSDVEKAGFQ